MGFTYLFMFVLVEECDSSAYPEDFQEVEVKDEPLEYDAVSWICFALYKLSFIFIIF